MKVVKYFLLSQRCFWTCVGVQEMRSGARDRKSQEILHLAGRWWWWGWWGGSGLQPFVRPSPNSCLNAHRQKAPWRQQRRSRNQREESADAHPASESGSSQLSLSVAIDVCGFVGQECGGTSLTLQGVEGCLVLFQAPPSLQQPVLLLQWQPRVLLPYIWLSVSTLPTHRSTDAHRQPQFGDLL